MEPKTRVDLQLSKGRVCVLCEKTATRREVVPAHYTGIRQHLFGKGLSKKCDDLFTADLCRTCHFDVDNPVERKSIEASEQFLFLILMSLWRDFLEGRLIFK